MGKYEEALERAKELHESGNALTKQQMEIVFPVLKESEDDRIRKRLVEYFNGYYDRFSHRNNVNVHWEGLEVKAVIAWLEKQKEQKPAEWIEKHIADIFEKVGLAKIVRDQGNDELTNALQDAMLELSKSGNAEWSEFDKGVLKDAICAVDILGNDESFNKGNPNLAKAFRIAKDWLKSFPERFNLQQKQEWSEEDEQYLLVCKNALNKYQRSDHWDATVILTWLENLLNSLRPQPHWKPSEEQMKALDIAIRCGIQLGTWEEDALNSLRNDLKSL